MLFQKRAFADSDLNGTSASGTSGAKVLFFMPPSGAAGKIRRKIVAEEKRIALLGIIVEDTGATEAINRMLHEYGEYIVGRMGIPYRSRGVSIISVVLDAPADAVSALSGRLGMLDGVSVKAVYSKR